MQKTFIPRLKSQFDKFMGRPSPGEERLRKKFVTLTGAEWFEPPMVFCTEKTKIHPKLIGRFYGENNIKKCALEIRRVDGQIVFCYAWCIRSRHTWANKSQAKRSNAYHSLVVDGPKIGTRNGIYFTLGSDGRYALGYKRFLEIVMKKL